MTVVQALVWVLVGLVVLGWAAWYWLTTPAMRASLRAAEKRRRADERVAAVERPKHLICPHCQTRGSVTVRNVTKKKGISGGKATGALLTFGGSLLLTGLSRKEGAQQMICSNCGTSWAVS